MNQTRRTFLIAGGTASVSAVAGCLEESDRSTDSSHRGDRRAYASFFTLSEFTRAVVGDAYEVDNAVPSGQHGHEWQPSVDVLPTVVESDVFVYLGVEGFQTWVDDAVDRIDVDHADDVALVDAAAGIDLLEYDGAHGHTHENDGHSHGDGHGRAEADGEIAHARSIQAIDLIDSETDERVADAHGDHWHGGPLAVAVNGSRTLEAIVEDEDGETIDPSTDRYSIDVRITGGDAFAAVDGGGDHVHVRGDGDGTATLVVQLLVEDEVVWESPGLDVRVGDGDDGRPDGSADDHGHSHDDGEHGHGHGDGGHDHSHGEYDAKFFSDPVLAQRGVEIIRDRLIEIDPDRESVYTSNAADYLEQLEALDDRYREALSDREHDHVLLAGHDSFQYLGERYGFEIHTPMGLSPDDEPSGTEIAAAVEFAEEHGLEYVLWDYFDGPELAETIAAEVDTVVGTEMVSPAESVVEAWDEEGYGGYVGQMVEINLPAFRRALGAR
ncbi:metal ABC transporter solute-binding protein, Zn/Mn family [Natrialba swarupiae]|uniref:Metal ion ABC transporter substrate-binding protein n=1 Tax=Natrialba swarupiae TaxID=2448032 RepID=A0A5D5AKQ8_9EURY|nr:zinc ABC transporter substrate-binding protein [Natrialba swarupiae]TYT61535.1 metal ion ABC transporter substrate-binding protein [Natrialba swarupiae]